MNIKDIDKISTSPRKGKKGFLKKLLDLTKGSGSDDKVFTITDSYESFSNKTKEEAMSILNLDEDIFDKLYSGYYDKLIFKSGNLNVSHFKTLENKTDNGKYVSVRYVSISFENGEIGGYSSYYFYLNSTYGYSLTVDEV